jgi:hypothetical protein
MPGEIVTKYGENGQAIGGNWHQPRDAYGIRCTEPESLSKSGDALYFV